MEKKFEEIKGEINRYISNMPIIPERVEEIIRKMFERLSEYYQLYFENDPSISETILEYIEGNRNEALAYLRKPQGANYSLIDEYYGDIQNILMKIEEKIECGEKTTNRDIEGINIELPDTKNKAVQNTQMAIKENIIDIISHVSSIMYNRGYSDERIDDMQEETRKWADRLMDNLNEERIGEEYSAVESDLTKFVQEKLFGLVEQRTSPTDNFRAEMAKIAGNISLEEQQSFINSLNSLSNPTQDGKEPSEKDENILGLSADEIL